MRTRVLVPVAIFGSLSCRSTEAPVPSPQLTVLGAVVNPLNQLSTILTVKGSHVDSVRIIYSSPDGRQDSTPFYPLTSGATRVATLGLTPSTAYSHLVEAYGPGGRDTLGPFVVTSGALPPALANLSLTVTGTPTSGHLLMPLTIDASKTAMVAFDSAGNVRWYRLFDVEGGGEDAQQQRNGDFTIFLGTTRGWDDTRGNFVEVKPTGELVRSLVAPQPLYTDGHELLLTFHDTALAASHFFGYELKNMTLDRGGTSVDTTLAVHTIVRLHADGSEAWRFSVEKLLSPSDWIEPPPALGDIDHPNSLTLDQNGNYIASFRNAGEITSIDSASGRVLWRLGGAHNQFTFLSDPLGGFSAQHFVRVLPNGHLLLFDNGWRHNPQQSRAVEYALDLQAHTATMVWEYRHLPAIFNQFVGSAQRLANGNTLVGWGFVGVATEVDASGRTVWEAKLNNGDQSHFYRILKVPSLYRFQAP